MGIITRLKGDLWAGQLPSFSPHMEEQSFALNTDAIESNTSEGGERVTDILINIYYSLLNYFFGT